MSTATLPTFRKLESRYVLHLQLEPEEALHVGSGHASARTDAPFFAGGDRIPGSSIRGALRSLLERLMQTVAPKRGCVLWEPCSHDTCPTANRDNLNSIGILTNECKRVEEISRNLCDICRLFGSPVFASRLRVSDGRIVGAKPEIRHGVGIDRDTGAAREGIKYDFETVEKGEGLQITFDLEIDNLDNIDQALLALLLGEIRADGLSLGGKRSRGLGRCTFKDKGQAVSYFDEARGFGLLKYLEASKLKDDLTFDAFFKDSYESLKTYVNRTEEDNDAAAQSE